MDLDVLFSAYEERQILIDRVLGAIALHYEFVNPLDYSAHDCASAGNVYSYLAEVLQVKNGMIFRRVVKDILIKEGIKPTNTGGIIWFKGLVEKEPGKDAILARKAIEQNRKDRDAYRKRQREFANRRNNKAHQVET